MHDIPLTIKKLCKVLHGCVVIRGEISLFKLSHCIPGIPAVQYIDISRPNTPYSVAPGLIHDWWICRHSSLLSHSISV